MLFIKNGHIKTMVGNDIENGYILVGDDGKILSVGENMDAPEGADVIDACGKLVTPGCVEAHCHIGLEVMSIGDQGKEHNEKSDPITPHIRAIDSIYPQDEAFSDAVSHGVTSACTGPGSTNVVGGTFAAIKLYGDCIDDMIIKSPVAMKCAFGENPKNAFGSVRKSPCTRMANAALLRELLFKSKRYLADKESGKDVFDMKLEAMIPVIKREIPLKAHAHRADDILTAIRIAKEFDVNMTIDHCTAGATIADKIASSGYPALVGPSFTAKRKFELADKSFATAATLHEAGVPISIITDNPVTPIEYLPLCAGLCVADGLPYEEAWKAITINPAKQMGISDRVGSLESGKDGDIVIWNDDPLKMIAAKVFMTVIDGKIVYKSK